MPVSLEVVRISPATTIVSQNVVGERVFKSSTWRKLSVIEFALQSFASVLEASHVKWFTHNQPAAKIIEIGRMKLDLHIMVRNILRLTYVCSLQFT